MAWKKPSSASSASSGTQPRVWKSASRFSICWARWAVENRRWQSGYRHVEIVFIRHTDRAEEVDEDTFFHGSASGGTLVSSALQAMHEIVRSRFRPADWNIYAAQASDGDNSFSDGVVAGRLLTELILPVSQFFAYLEVDENGGSTFDMPDSSPISTWR